MDEILISVRDGFILEDQLVDFIESSPENLERMIELRRYSKKMDDVIQGYKKGLEIYEDRIEILNLEKKMLQKKLFPNNVN